jgi:hypothetical protein
MASDSKEDRMSLLLLASQRINVHPALIFKVALDRAEVRMNPQNARELYEECAISDVYPTVVEDFALSILAGQIKVKKRKGLPPHTDN